MISTPLDDRPPTQASDDETHLSETGASGGKKLGTMRYVLGISMVAVIVIFALILLWYR